MSRARAWGVAAAALLAMSACEFGGQGDAAGCVRVAQGDFEFPPKRIIEGAVEVRVTQRGFDRVTERIKEIVLGLFGADAEGRAVIPLDALGLGAIGTGFGPLQAQLRDVVITLDLSALSVTLTPNSAPARLEVRVDNAEIGLVDGVVAGILSGTFFSGDVGCRLANGPNDRIARLSMRLSFTLAIDASGRVDLRVLPSTFDLQELALEVVTDCDVPECLDGLPPGSTEECSECEALCPAASFLSSLTSALQSTFANLFNTLLSAVGDRVANLLLGLFVNDRPLTVEGLLPVANVLGPVLEWFRSVRPLAIFTRPAREGIAVTGQADGLGLELVLDMGLDANTHPCLGPIGADPELRPGPRPRFDGLVRDRAGQLVPYDVAVGISDAIVNQGLHALWKSGAFCIAITSADLLRLTQGSLRVGAGTMDLLLPGYAGLVGPSAPIRLGLRPRLDVEPRPVRFDEGEAVTVLLPDAELGVDAWIGNAWVRVLTMRADLRLGVDVQPTEGSELVMTLGGLALEGIRVDGETLFTDAALDIIAPWVVDLALGFLAESPLSFSLGTAGALHGTGISLAPVVTAIGPVGQDARWLGVHLTLEPVPPVEAQGLWGGRPSLTPPAVSTSPAGSGAPPELILRGGTLGTRWRVRAEGGLWSRAATGRGPHRWALPRFAAPGAHRVEVEGVGRDGAREVWIVPVQVGPGEGAP